MRSNMPKRSLLFGSFLLLATLGAVVDGANAATPNPGCCDVLRGVDASAPSDVWAVGEYRATASAPLRTLVLHWDGVSWKRVSSPNVGASDNTLSRVSVLARDNAWAVGGYGGIGRTRTLVTHWDGRTWRVVTSPNLPGGANFLYDVDGVAANDVWAAGRADSGPSQAARALVVHWDGRVWKIVSSPNVGQSEMFGVSAVSRADVWAVGQRSQASGPLRTLSLHWDGRTWKVVSTPNAGADSNFLFGGVAAVSASDAWAVGGYDSGRVFKPLTLHWNGRTWSLVPSPSGSTRGAVLYGGVSATSSTNVWAVGQSGWGRTFVLRWNGSVWRQVVSPNVGSRSNELLDVVTLSPTSAWSVGAWSTGTTYRTLVERWNGTAWSVQ